MKAFVKNLNGNWCVEEDENAILDAKDCIFIETIEEAAEYINVNFNELYPDFDIAHIDKRWRSENETVIIRHNKPILRENVSAKRFIELIKEKEIISIQKGWELRKRWEKELDTTLENLGIISRHGCFEYNPEEAKKEIKALKRKARKPTKKKNFIRMDQIRTVNYGIMRAINAVLRQEFSQLYIEIIDGCYYGGRKFIVCKRFFMLKTFINNFFGKNTHRHIKQFQNLKKSWIKEKPISHTSTKVTKEFFDFMEEEIKKRKPRKKELKAKWMKNS